jgi:hypothetical protein
VTDDDLRAALAAADPVRSADLDPLTSPRTRELMERTMTTPTTPTTPTTDLRSHESAARPADRPTTSARRPWLAAVAAVVLAGGGAAYLSTTGSADAPAGGELVLALPGGDPALQSCLPVSADTLGTLPVAFAGTATAVADGEVRLEVDRWYRGGDATTVVLRNPGEEQQALVGAADFEPGQDYLVSADGGTVSVCGLTGPASPELRAVYDEAFAG